MRKLFLVGAAALALLGAAMAPSYVPSANAAATAETGISKIKMERKLQRRAASLAARRAARSEGVNWKQLSRSERKARRAAARVTEADLARARQKLSKRARMG